MTSPAGGRETTQEQLRDRIRDYLIESTLSHTERFELQAERFYRETGFMAPGKSLPLEMGSQDKRSEAWDAWNERRKLQWRQDMRDVLAALASSAGISAPQWQPIETAPKDGTDILAFGPFIPTGGNMDIARWTDYGGGFWDWSADDSQPTHWMPLPTPPTNGEQP